MKIYTRKRSLYFRYSYKGRRNNFEFEKNRVKTPTLQKRGAGIVGCAARPEQGAGRLERVTRVFRVHVVTDGSQHVVNNRKTKLATKLNIFSGKSVVVQIHPIATQDEEHQQQRAEITKNCTWFLPNREQTAVACPVSRWVCPGRARSSRSSSAESLDPALEKIR